MPELSRPQIAVYGAVAVALLLVGARAIRGEGGGEASYASGSTFSSDSGGSTDSGGSGGDGGDFTLSGEAGDLIVDVTGAVARPGVYRLPAGSRVDDAVKRAGGATGGAELEAVNLAAKLADGQQVVVPEAGVAGASIEAGDDGPIGLGTATVEQLDTIDGIGPVTAEDIVKFREEHGGLSSVDQLDQISGIGPTTMESLRERLAP
jgi:competence protein ComEA